MTKRGLVWLALYGLCGALTIWMLLRCLPATLDGQQYVPVGPDSFYHGVRIFGVAAGRPLLQFDPGMYAPEGTWISWPWAYDLMLGRLLAATGNVDRSEGMRMLAWVPVVWALVNLALVFAIGGLLRLRHWAVAAAGIAFATAYGTSWLHMPGMLDHHYVELSCVLASLCAGLLWVRSERALAAWVCGWIVGFAPAFHNGLFVLQIPYVVWFTLGWGFRRPRPRHTGPFLVGLALGTVGALLPAELFWKGAWEFYFLSRFHGYVALCTLTWVLLLQRLRPDRKGMLLLLLAGAILAIPLVSSILPGLSFAAGSGGDIASISEARSPFSLRSEDRLAVEDALLKYGVWIYCLPLIAGLFIWRLARSRRFVDDHRHQTDAAALFAVFSLFGCIMLAGQFRFYPYGSFVLWLGPLVLADALTKRGSALVAAGIACSSLLFLWLWSAPGFSMGSTYRYLHPLFPRLAAHCQQHPGIVLVDNDFAHAARFYSDCAVLASPMFNNDFHQSRREKVRALLDSEPQQVLAAREISYVLVVADFDAGYVQRSPDAHAEAMPKLVYRLLFSEQPGFQSLGVVALSGPRGDVPIAKLLRVQRDAR